MDTVVSRQTSSCLAAVVSKWSSIDSSAVTLTLRASVSLLHYSQHLTLQLADTVSTRLCDLISPFVRTDVSRIVLSFLHRCGVLMVLRADGPICAHDLNDPDEFLIVALALGL